MADFDPRYRRMEAYEETIAALDSLLEDFAGEDELRSTLSWSTRCRLHISAEAEAMLDDAVSAARLVALKRDRVGFFPRGEQERELFLARLHR